MAAFVVFSLNSSGVINSFFVKCLPMMRCRSILFFHFSNVVQFCNIVGQYCNIDRQFAQGEGVEKPALWATVYQQLEKIFKNGPGIACENLNILADYVFRF